MAEQSPYKTGIVVNAKPGFVKVRFPDLDDLVTDWIPTSHEATMGARSVRTMDIGTQVGCVMDEHFEDGQVIGARYSDADPSPVTDPNIVHQDWGEGASYDFNRATGTLVVVLGGMTLTLSAAGLDIQGGDVKADNISLKFHPHKDVQTGSDQSGTPVASS